MGKDRMRRMIIDGLLNNRYFEDRKLLLQSFYHAKFDFINYIQMGGGITKPRGEIKQNLALG